MKVVLGDAIAPAAIRVLVDGLVVAEANNDEQADQDEGDRHDLRKGHGGGGQHKDPKAFFGCVRDGRERVGRKHRKPGDVGQPFLVGMLRRDGAAEEGVFPVWSLSHSRWAA